MAFQVIELNSDEWTLIQEGKTNVTFQNLGINPMLINVSNSTPVESAGIRFDQTEGVINRPLTEISSAGANVYARASTRNTTVVVEV